MTQTRRKPPAASQAPAPTIPAIPKPDVPARLAALPGVAHVYVRGITAGRLTADLDFDGTAADLAAALERAGYTVRSLSSEAIAL